MLGVTVSVWSAGSFGADGDKRVHCAAEISPLFHLCAEPCNKSLQMKILSWLEGYNSCWVL